MPKYSNLLKKLKQNANSKKAIECARFFKTAKGEYGQEYIFLGIMMPKLHQLAKKYDNLNLIEIEKLLKNKYHEVQLVAILILVNKYKKASIRKDLKENEKIYKFYLKNIKYINSWSLVDLSAQHIVGDYLLNKDRRILEKLTKSKNLWERRIAIISTLAFINNREFVWTFKIVKILLKDKEDLIHKACGWMLREVAKKVSQARLKTFLGVYSTKMPRTMLRYSIEHFTEIERKYYLNRKKN